MPETTESQVDLTEEGTTTKEAVEKALRLSLQEVLADARERILAEQLASPAARLLYEAEKAVVNSWYAAAAKNMVPALRPDAEGEAQAAISEDIDAIVKRLDEGIPRLNARLDKLLERQRRPLTV